MISPGKINRKNNKSLGSHYSTVIELMKRRMLHAQRLKRLEDAYRLIDKKNSFRVTWVSIHLTVFNGTYEKG